MSRIRYATVLLAAGFAAALPGAARAADPVPLTSAQIQCTGDHEDVNLPLATGGAVNTIYSVTSDGATGYVQDGLLRFGAVRLVPGSRTWDRFGSLSAGTAPPIYVDCTGGAVHVAIYAAPTAPATFSGNTLGPSSRLYFVVPGRARYLADVSVSQGAIRLGGIGGLSTTIASSQQVPLGSLNGGFAALNGGFTGLSVTQLPGPPATWSVTIHALPITVSDLRFTTAASRPGVPLTARFSVEGPTQITSAVIRDARGNAVNSLGSFPVNGSSSITWNGLAASGAPVPDGTYQLELTSQDPLGNVTMSSAPVIIDRTPPRTELVSGGRLAPLRGWVARVVDNVSGVERASASIGQQTAQGLVAAAGNQAQVTIAPPRGGWLPGRHRFEIIARDRAGNMVTSRGTFTVAVGGRRVVLGSRRFARARGRGWGASRPREVSRGGMQTGVVGNVRWRSWGTLTALGVGRSTVATNRGGVRAVSVRLRARDVGRCTANGPLAYRQLSYRYPVRPGGRLTPWRRWSSDRTLCRMGT